MKYLVLLCMIGAAVARPGPDAAVAEPLPFHYRSTGSLDEYSFSYAAEDSSKTETRDKDGTVVGGYQYIDSDGVLQKVQYKAGVDGVQILASNLPVGSTDPVQDLPEVQRAAEEHFHAVQKSLQLIARARVLEEEYKAKVAARRAAEAAAKHH